MKKTVYFLLCFLQILSLTCFSAMAEKGELHWYCVHVKNHVQPTVGRDIAFVEELDGYYIDHRHASAEDADKVVYLTFDAGYENGNVARVLDTLKEERVTAAFFVLGHLIETETALVKRMTEEGHIVANHSVHHKNMAGFSDADFLKELTDLEQMYAERVGGKMPRYYRPAQGCFSRQNLECAQKNGYKTIFWSFAYADWDNEKQPDPQKAKQIILDNVHNGAVILLHPTSATNAKILGEVIREMKAQGYRFGSLEELTCAKAE